jgi:hypothetical protein
MRVDFSNRNIKRLDSILLEQYLGEFKRENKELKTLLGEGAIENLDGIDVKEFIEILLFDNNSISKLENLNQFINLKRVCLGSIFL